MGIGNMGDIEYTGRIKKKVTGINRKLISVLHIVLLAVLVIIPIGLIYQSIRTYLFPQTCPGHSSCGSIIGILYLILIPAEIYVLLIWGWLRYLRATEMNNTIYE
jgi:hypothetical protein